MRRKTSTNTIDEMVRVMSQSQLEAAPPAHVRMQDMDWPFWHSVVAEFARADWTEHQLELAAMLARGMADLEEQQHLLRGEGFITQRESGMVVENPRSRVVQNLAGSVLSFRRSLALHARARSGSNYDAGKQREAGKATEARGKSPDHLLA